MTAAADQDRRGASAEANGRARRHATAGRYERVNRAAIPGELPKPGRVTANIEIKHAVVPDPNPCLRGDRQRVATNIKTDALEFEYARDRISVSGYWAARTYQAVIERSQRPASGAGAWNPGNRVDQVISHELAILNRIVAAQDSVKMVQETAPVIGMLGGRALELVLIDGLTLKQVAQRMSGNGERMDVYFWSQTFRMACEALADFWCGPRNRAPRV